MGRFRIGLVEELRKLAEEVASEKGASSDKEIKYQPQPKYKPPRRETFNESGTREYRNNYQERYRAENGNGYIKKPKKKKETKDESTGRF